MARMMDSLILDNLAPFAFTKITTTHRPLRSLKKATSTTNVPTSASAAVQQNVGYTHGNGLGVPCMNAGGSFGPPSANANNTTIRINLQKQKLPTQGEYFDLLFSKIPPSKNFQLSV
jgi:hypothetical protein